jgi:CubicO group peptidase (beta-lactamase class C family)
MRAARLGVLGIVASLALAGRGALPHPGAVVDAAVRAEMARQRVPGVALAVVQRGTVLVAKDYGLANVEEHVAVTPETIPEKIVDAVAAAIDPGLAR